MDNGRKVNCSCGCSKENTVLLYSCSGSADVGEIADRIVRKLRHEQIGKMTCLAGIGADLTGFIESAKGTNQNITIDGCQVACAKKTLERIGVTPISYILTDMGLTKGITPVSDEIILEMSQKIKQQRLNPVAS